MKRDIQTHRFTWNDTTIEVRYEPDWLGMSAKSHSTAHLEVRSIDPPKQMIPITQTGYRSHFTTRLEIDTFGGPVEFVRAWLGDAAKDPAWREREAAARQFSLF